MRLARFRRFASVLVLVLLAGLAAPALAAASAPAAGPVHAHAHVHAVPDGSGAAPAKVAHCCPHCAAAWACGVFCLGVGILPASVPVPPLPEPGTWPAGRHAQPSGTVPPRDTDPPRPVPAR